MAVRKKKNKWAFPIGVIAIILAAVGLVSTVKFGIKSIKNIADNSGKKAEYENMLLPVVMFDPDPFDDLTQANISQLVNSAVWALLMSEDGTENYAYSEGGIVVPQADIEKYFIALFGNEIDIKSLHASIDMSEYGITYDSAMQSYILPITGIESAYTPKVYDIKKQGSSVILTVGYIGTKAWVQIENGEMTAPEPDKYMEITLRERSGGMYISSIQNGDAQEVIAATVNYLPNIPPEENTEPVVDESTVVPQEGETVAVEVTNINGEVEYDDEGNAVTEYVTAAAAEVTEEVSGTAVEG